MFNSRSVIFGAAIGFIGVSSLVAQSAAKRGSRLVRSIVVRDDGPAILAVGDTLRLALHQYQCHGDECDLVTRGEALPARWVSGAPRSVPIDNRGTLRGLAPVQTNVSAIYGGATTRLAVRVLPPVRDLRWTDHPTTLHVGDTLRIAVIARDSSGRTVELLAPIAHVGGTGGSGQVLWGTLDRGLTKVFLDRAGELVLVGRLAHRTDTLRIRVIN